MSKKHEAEAARHFDRALAAGNVGAVRQLLRSRQVHPTADLLRAVYDKAPLGIVAAILDAGVPPEPLLDEKFDDLIAGCDLPQMPGKLELLLSRSDLSKLQPPPVVQARQHPKALAVLLARGADPNARDLDGGQTALQLLVSAGEKNAAAIDVLLAAGADPRICRPAQLDYGGPVLPITLLHLACAGRRRRSLVPRLLATGLLDVNALVAGQSALSCAIAGVYDLDIISLLLEAGADPNLGTPSAISTAVERCLPDVALILCLHGARPPKPSFNGLWRSAASVFRLLAICRLFGGEVTMAEFERAAARDLQDQWRRDPHAAIRSAVPLCTEKIP